MHVHRNVSPVAAAVLAASILSCGSEPTRPSNNGYSSPQVTLSTLQASMSGKAQSHAVYTYIACFADSLHPGDPAYHHDFAPSDVAAFTSECGCPAPSNWTIGHERAFFPYFRNLAPMDEYSVVFDTIPSRPDPPATPTSAILYRVYLVRAGSAWTSRLLSAGFVDLTFVRLSDDRWVISRWDDHQGPILIDPLPPSLGRLRLDSTR